MRILLMLLMLLPGIAAAQSLPPACPSPSPDGGLTTYRDFTDTVYGSKVRQIVRPAGNDHNLYHWRNPWNANNTYMLGYREMGVDPNDHSGATSYQALYDGNGCFLRLLYTIGTYNYQGVWDKTDPNIFYTHHGSDIVRYNVSNDQVDVLMELEVAPATGATVTLNQAGTRLGIALSGTTYGVDAGRFRSWALPNMTDQREFMPTDGTWTATQAASCDKRNWRYIGWQNYVVTDCRNDPGNVYGSGFYNDDGTFLRYHAREIGHTDVGPGGKWAYFVENAPVATAVQIHLVDLATGSDNVIHTFPAGGDFDNMHLSWPRANPDFFIIGFFSNCSNPPTATTQTDVPFDQMYKITASLTPTVTIVGKTFTCEYASNWDPDGTGPLPSSPVVNNQGIQSYFWTQPEPEVSGDGSRVTWNINCDQRPINLAAPIPANNCTQAFEGDQAIVFLADPTPPEPPMPPTCTGWTTNDYVDSTYGYVVRQVQKTNGQEHNLDHRRPAFNLNSTRMLGVREDSNKQNGQLSLYDGFGCWIEDLFAVNSTNWKARWSVTNASLFYYRDALKLYSYNVTTHITSVILDLTGTPESFTQEELSFNSDGSRIFLITCENCAAAEPTFVRRFSSWRLSDGGDRRTFSAPVNKACDLRNARYTGYTDVIALDCFENQALGSWFYHDDGTLARTSTRTLTGNDFAPAAGKWMYTTGTPPSVTIRAQDILTGANDVALLTDAGTYAGQHITCARDVTGWCIVGFFGTSGSTVPYTNPPYDEIMRLYFNGTVEYLARTRTVDAAGYGPAGYYLFWTQPLPSVAMDGSRVSWNGICWNESVGVDCIPDAAHTNNTTGPTADTYVLFLDPIVVPPVLPVAAMRRNPIIIQ